MMLLEEYIYIYTQLCEQLLIRTLYKLNRIELSSLHLIESST
jgi:hypothetical protein